VFIIKLFECSKVTQFCDITFG